MFFNTIWERIQKLHGTLFTSPLFWFGVFVGIFVNSIMFFPEIVQIPLKASVFQGGGIEQGMETLKQNVEDNDIGIIESNSIIDTIIFLVRYILIIAGLAAFIAFLWAGVLYVTSFVNEENNETAKKVMISAAIGIVLILLSYAIVTFLTTLTL